MRNLNIQIRLKIGYRIALNRDTVKINEIFLNFDRITVEGTYINNLHPDIYKYQNEIVCRNFEKSDEQAISSMKLNFIMNNYPETLINTKMNEIVNRNFEKSDFRKSQILKQKQSTHDNSHIDES